MPTWEFKAFIIVTADDEHTAKKIADREVAAEVFYGDGSAQISLDDGPPELLENF